MLTRARPFPGFPRAFAGLFAVCLVVGGLIAWVPSSEAQRAVPVLSADEAQEQLDRALAASEEAEARAAAFEQEAEEADEAVIRVQRETAALAAQIQASEADIVAARARYSLAQVERGRLAQRLASRQQPIVRLTAALQTSARRPLALSALQPGSLKELVYVRAVLDSAIPQIQERTAGLRKDLDAGRELERRAERALASVNANEKTLRERQAELAALVTRQRLSLREARQNASREAQRALALAENARDLDGLVGQLSRDAALREELAALPGPVLRPAGLSPATTEALPDLAEVPDTDDSSADTAVARPQPVPLASFQLPVQGRTLAGFGEQRASGLRSNGLTLAPVPGAQIVVPASGRIAFAGPYEGFGRIVIIEHPGGWTSVVTGMARTSVATGQEVAAGEPLGNAGTANQPVSIELRREGEPVNPLSYLR